jgi:brefeldin A-inhibited guanine nucleotide-exchange protein
VQTVCDCCSEQQEEAVQLQVMKALLECVISSHTEVHQASLLQAVRACYNINLVSRNAVNRTTAKATLTQMLSIVFQRMEAFDRRAKEEAQAALFALGQHAQQAAVATALSPGKGGVGSPTKQPQLQQLSPPSPARAHEGGSPPRPAAGAAARGGGGPNMYPSVFAKLGFRASPSSAAAPRRHMVAAGGRSSSSASSGTGAPEFPSVLHKDAYLLFRALCRLSVKGQYDGDPSQPADPVALQSKILSLELLLSILENAGPCFRGSDKFVYLVRNHLCSSLLKNATSSNTAIVGLSLRIFVAMTAHFKDSLKAELEVRFAACACVAPAFDIA